MQQEVTVGKQTYLIDWELTAQIVRQYNLAHYQIQMSKIHTSEQDKSGALSFLVPQMRTVETPWERVRERATQQTKATLEDYHKQIEKDVEGVLNDLARKERAIPGLKAAMLDQNKLVAEINSDLMKSSEESLQGSIDILKFYQDASASTLIFASSLMTGGATAYGALAMGSTLKGVAKYQDKGNIGAGIVAGVGEFAIGMFSIGGKLSRLKSLLPNSSQQKAVMLLAKGTHETATGWFNGDDLGKAVQNGATKVAVDGAVGLVFDSSAVKGAFKKMPMPVKIAQGGGLRAKGYLTKSLGREFAQEFTKKVSKDKGKEGAKALIAAATDSHGPTYGAIAGESIQSIPERVNQAIKKKASQHPPSKP